MKRIFLRMISLFVSSVMLLLFAPGSGSTEPFDVKDPASCVLSLTVFSDVHVESNNYPRYKVFADSLKNAVRNKTESDAFLFLGDSVMNGQNIENMLFHGTTSKLLKDRKVIAVPGNHDFGNGKGDYEKIRQRWYTYTEAFFGKKLTTPYYCEVLNGFYCIVLSSEAQNIDSMFMSEAQFEWLERTLKAAAQSGLPTFVLAHYPPRMAQPIDPDSTYDLCRMLAEYNREHDLFYLCGHLHHVPDAATFHAWSGFPEVYLPCETQLAPAGNQNVICSESGFGALVEAYPDRVVIRIRNFYFGQWAELGGAPMEATYTLKNPIPAA